MIWLIVAILVFCWIGALAWQAPGISIHALLISAVALTIVELLRRQRKGLPQDPAPLFLTEFEISPTWNFPGHFKVKDWHGLILCQVINRGTSEAHLLAWWDSKASYDDYWAVRFKTDLLLRDPVFQGAMIRRKSSDEKWWAKLKSPIVIYSIFISMVALVTGIIQFKTFLDWAWAVPDTTLTAKESLEHPIVVVVDEPYTLIIEANNNISSECEVELSEPEVSSSPNQGSLAFAENNPRIRKLAGSSPIDISYHLTAMTPGQYEIRFHGKQHSGQMIGWQPIRSDLTYRIDVWPQVDEHPTVRYLRITPEGIAVFLVTAKHGRPLKDSIIRYQAGISGEDLSFEGVNPGSVKTPPTNNGGVAVIRWEAMPTVPPPPQPLAPQSFDLTMKSKVKRDENYWHDLALKFVVGAK